MRCTDVRPCRSEPRSAARQLPDSPQVGLRNRDATAPLGTAPDLPDHEPRNFLAVKDKLAARFAGLVERRFVARGSEHRGEGLVGNATLPRRAFEEQVEVDLLQVVLGYAIHRHRHWQHTSSPVHSRIVLRRGARGMFGGARSRSRAPRSAPWIALVRCRTDRRIERWQTSPRSTNTCREMPSCDAVAVAKEPQCFTNS